MSDEPTITVAEIARRLGATPVGAGARLIRIVATLEQAGPDAASWLGDQAYLPKLAGTKAGVVLVPPGVSVPSGQTAIVVRDPDAAICAVLGWLAPPVETVPVGIHPTAIVAPDGLVDGAAIGANVYVGARARIGPGTQLHPGVYAGADSVIGRNCVLWPNVVVRERVTIGDRVVIHPNATIGADGFGYLFRDGQHRKIPQIGTVLIEDDVEIGANSTVDRARSGVTRIRRGTKIDNLVMVGHNAEIGEDCVIVAQTGLAGSTTLGHHVVLSGQVGLVDHVRVGNGVQVAAQSVVTRDWDDGKVLRGTPAVEVRLFTRQQAAVRKLPKWIEHVRELTKRVVKLEAAADDTTRD